jgi:hypothetical protein
MTLVGVDSLAGGNDSKRVALVVKGLSRQDQIPVNEVLVYLHSRAFS